MEYSELKEVAESKKILITEVAEAVGMTSTGFKRAIEVGSFPIGKVRELCRVLGLSVGQFFGGASYDMEDMPPTMAAESVPVYAATVGKHGSEIDMIATLISHISWLEAEIDRLRAENERLTSK